MSDLWYPGRHPFCTPELIDLLGYAIEALARLIAEEDGSQLDTLEGVCDAALIAITEESEACLGTDENLQSLHSLFLDSFKGAVQFYKGKAWRNIYELATNLALARNQLIEAVEGATDDGRAIQTDTDNGAGTGSDEATSAEQTHEARTAGRREQESKETLSGNLEEAQT